jgi:hypothetical protein
MMVAKGVVPLSFLMDFQTRGLVVIWHRLRPFVEQLRKKRNQSGHLKQFQMLAIEAKKHRDADKRYSGEETFELGNEDQNAWSEWRKAFETVFGSNRNSSLLFIGMDAFR